MKKKEVIMTAQELLEKLKELAEQNEQAASFSLRYPDAEMAEKFAQVVIQDRTWREHDETFEALKIALEQCDEDERVAIATQAMKFCNLKPVATSTWRRFEKRGFTI